MRIGIIGSGAVGKALATGLARHGHETRIGTRKDEVDGLPVGAPSEVAAESDLVFLAVQGAAAVEVADGLAGELTGKVLVDTTNPLEVVNGSPGMFVGHTDSLGERVQRAAPRAQVVKAYNTVGNELMVDPNLPGGPPTMFIAGDSEHAKAMVADLLDATGWEVADLGGIEASRYLEAMCVAWVRAVRGSGNPHQAFKLLGR
ncbi:MAG: 8-hydroxy-5-deazaflavin:NADPH oxidoreductase [Nocardioidaceae bacterium]|jgi:predicted dinucleotide-binding enzyme|nr:8-hydroxy-5-deazaflavin:NADPH oxidoreductase [Nocardioidaceae bacterium]